MWLPGGGNGAEALWPCGFWGQSPSLTPGPQGGKASTSHSTRSPRALRGRPTRPLPRAAGGACAAGAQGAQEQPGRGLGQPLACSPRDFHKERAPPHTALAATVSTTSVRPFSKHCPPRGHTVPVEPPSPSVTDGTAEARRASDFGVWGYIKGHSCVWVSFVVLRDPGLRCPPCRDVWGPLRLLLSPTPTGGKLYPSLQDTAPFTTDANASPHAEERAVPVAHSEGLGHGSARGSVVSGHRLSPSPCLPSEATAERYCRVWDQSKPGFWKQVRPSHRPQP